MTELSAEQVWGGLWSGKAERAGEGQVEGMAPWYLAGMGGEGCVWGEDLSKWGLSEV